MKDLHTIVCLKVVPKPEEVTIDPVSLTLDRAHARSEINPADMHALEEALSLKDRYGGRISLLAMGPPLFDPYLRVALAMAGVRPMARSWASKVAPSITPSWSCSL